MNQPTRWSQGGGSSELSELVRGLPAPQPLPALAQQELGAFASQLGAGGALATRAALRGALMRRLAPYVGVLAVVGAVAGLYWRASEPRVAPLTVVVTPPQTLAVQSLAPAVSSLSEDIALPSSPSPQAAAASSARTSASRGTPADTLVREAALLREAQGQLGSSPSAALELTRQHAAEFPRGKLAAERELVAIDALLRLGRRVEAEARGVRLLRADPNGFYAPRVRGLLAR